MPVSTENQVTIAPDLMEILRCPGCRSAMSLRAQEGDLLCSGCGLVYPVRDGVAILVATEARRNQ
jgi:uncharacterized protein YbaR (Trm112 family)